MRSNGAARKVAAIAVFSTIYAVLNQIPVSEFIGGTGTLTLAEAFSPVSGMVLGAAAGASSMFLGTFESVILGRPLVFYGFDFIPAVAAAVTAGLAVRGKTWWVSALSIALFLGFSLDPFSLAFVNLGGFPVPYFWMQLLALATFGVVSQAKRFSKWSGLAGASVIAVVFLSTMNAEVAGGIMYENLFVLGGVLSAKTVLGLWPLIFYAYPVERAFFTVFGSIIALPILRALPRAALRSLHGEVTEAPR